MAVERKKVLWFGGLVVAIVSAILGYLGGGCTPLQAQRAAQTASALDTACEAVTETTTDAPELVKARQACREWLAYR
jgi:hypothetical protein